MSKKGVRFIPRGKDPRETQGELASARRWHLKQATVRNAETGAAGEFIYLVPKTETFVIIRDDPFAGMFFGSVVGPNQDRIAAEIMPKFNPWPEPELFAWWDRGVENDDAGDRIDAVLCLGVNSPEQPKEEYVKRIRAGLNDRNKDVRNVAVAATAYADWRVFRPDLERIANADPDEKARERAHFILDGWAKEDAEQSASSSGKKEP